MFVPLLVASHNVVTLEEKIENYTKYFLSFNNNLNKLKIIREKWRIVLTPVVFKKDDL